MKYEYYETICNNHNVIIGNLQRLKKMVKDAESREVINETLCFVRHCKKQGQHMENRMKLVNDTICNVLGYQRIRKS